MISDLCTMGAVEALRLFCAGTLSPRELLEVQIRRISEINDSVNCIAYPHFEEARRQAEESERRYRQGNPRALEGLTVAVKDDADVRGWRHHWGSLLLKEREPAEVDHPVVDMLRNAGAVMHIQTTAPEFFLAGVTWSYLWGVTRNPWNKEYTPGGSSGGSAAALAAGMTTLALGSDMGGSIRIPAAMCGLYGFKPPFGRVPTSEVSYETFGPLARSFADMNLMQQAISGPHPHLHASLKPKLDYPAVYGDVRGWKVAVDPLRQYGAEVDEAAAGALDNAVETLRKLGCQVDELDLGFRHEEFAVMLAGLMSTEMGMLTVMAAEAPQALTPYVRDFLETYGGKAGPQYAGEAAELLARYHLQVQEKVFRRGYSAIVMPTMLTPYVKANWFSTPEGALVGVNGRQVESRMGFFTTWMWNLLSRYPVVNVPAGLTPENLPLGVQIIADTYEDLRAFQLASAYSEVAPRFFTEIYPPE